MQQNMQWTGNYYLLTGEILQHDVIFVKNLQEAFYNADICFLFQSLRSEISSELSFKMKVEECKFSSYFPDMFTSDL